MHTRLRGNTVNDEQRVVGTFIERADTADTDRRCTGRRAIGRNVHTGDASLKRFHRVVFILLGQVFRVDGRDGTGKVGLALNRITGHDYLVQQLGVLVQDHSHLSLGRKFLRSIADGGEDQDGTLLHRDGEVAVKVCRRTIAGTFFHDRGANDAVAVGRRGHSTCNRDLLGGGGDACQQKGRNKK